MEIARHWRTKNQRLRLEGEICPNAHIVFPPRDICPSCGEHAENKFTLSGKGTIYSYTTIYEPPTKFEAQAPYHIAIIQLVEGPRMTAQLTDFDREPKIDEEVEAVIRKITEQGETGIIEYNQKFRPATESSSSSK